DGTLCDIVERPDDAFVPPQASAALAQLNRLRERDVHVALITGRSVADAKRMVGFDGVVIYGNHGSERASRAGTLYQPEGWSAIEASLRAAASVLARVAHDFPGARLENKHFSLTLHYRDIDMTRADELRQRTVEATKDRGLVVSDGKCVINVVPEGVHNKGDAALEVIAGVAAGRDMAAASILFAGDDVTDEDAFVALQHFTRAVTVRVGKSPRPTAARFALSSPREVHELLEVLLQERS
ncbi:MAG: trehalose-phosphatase, partial [Gemmatimonadota bacterium]|nr:trehalose-phosphatase [Gemmatimonadota bacterium]